MTGREPAGLDAPFWGSEARAAKTGRATPRRWALPVRLLLLSSSNSAVPRRPPLMSPDLDDALLSNIPRPGRTRNSARRAERRRWCTGVDVLYRSGGADGRDRTKPPSSMEGGFVVFGRTPSTSSGIAVSIRCAGAPPTAEWTGSSGRGQSGGRPERGSDAPARAELARRRRSGLAGWRHPEWALEPRSAPVQLLPTCAITRQGDVRWSSG
jgi:hypothetical protein